MKVYRRTRTTLQVCWSTCASWESSCFWSATFPLASVFFCHRGKSLSGRMLLECEVLTHLCDPVRRHAHAQPRRILEFNV